MEDNKDYFKVTIDSKNFQQYNRNTEHFEPRMDASTLSRAENLLKSFERAIQSATNSFDGFQSSLKRVATRDDLSNPRDPVYSGRFQQSFYVQAKELDNVMRAIKAHNTALTEGHKVAESIGDAGFDISSSAAREITRYKTLKGREAVNLAREGLSNINGRLEHVPTAKNPDRYRISVLMGENEYASMTEGLTGGKATGAVTRYINEAIRPANRMSSYTAREEKARQEEQQKKKEEQEQAKELNARNRTLVKITQAILAGVTVATVLLRKMGSAIVKNAAETIQNATTGTALGLSSSEVRSLNTFDAAHGMSTGTMVGAVAAVQDAFGNIFNLQEGTLDALAPVVGGNLASLVKHGIGQKDPLELTKMILDSYFSKFINTPEEARASKQEFLISHLKDAMPALSTVLENMITEWNQGAYARSFSNVDEYLATTQQLADIKQKGKVEEVEQITFGQNWADAMANIQNQLDNALTDFISSLSGFVDSLKSTTVGLESNEKADTWNAIRNKNLEIKDRIVTDNALLNSAYLGDVNKLLGMNYTSLGSVDVEKFKGKLIGDPRAYRAVLYVKAGLKGIQAIDDENKKTKDVKSFDQRLSESQITSNINNEIEAQLGQYASSLNFESERMNWGGYSGYLDIAKESASNILNSSDVMLDAVRANILSILSTTDTSEYKDPLIAYLVDLYNQDVPEPQQIGVNGKQVNFYKGQKKNFINYLNSTSITNKELLEALKSASKQQDTFIDTPYSDLIKASTMKILNEEGVIEGARNKKDNVSFLDSSYGNNYFGGLISPFSGSPLAFGGQAAGVAQERVLKVQFADSNGSIIAQKTISFAENETEAFPDSVKLDLSNIIG